MLSFNAYLLPALTALVNLAIALPNVTVVPATGGCSDITTYNNTTGMTDLWTPILQNSDNSSIEDFGSDYQLIGHEGDTGIHQGRVYSLFTPLFHLTNKTQIVIGNAIDEAKLPFRCNDAVPARIESRVPSGVSGYSWTATNISYLPWDAELGWGFENQYSIPLETYWHYIDGVKQPGVFLGNNGTTTWAVKYEPGNTSDTENTNAYWNMRFLGWNSGLPWENGTALDVGEYRTFLRVNLL